MNLSDDDFLASPPPTSPTEEEKVSAGISVETSVETPQEPIEVETPPTESPTDEKLEQPVVVPETPSNVEPPKEAEAVVEKTETVDYEAAYKKIMAPLRANGKTIDLRDPDEVIQLMQMGANYTRKMQALSKHRKLLTMMEQHNLLDEGKLSFLIDLDKKNPEAIKRLLKESGTDPLSIDLDSADQYQEGSHRVSDEEARLNAVLEDVSSTPGGKEMLRELNASWDQSSKDIIWNDPDVITVLNEQRLSGVYDQIVTEMNRQITLGKIPANTPFLHAYKYVGDALMAQKPQAPAQAEPAKPVAQRVVVPTKSAVPDRAAAASTSRSSPPSAPVSYANLSDEEFLKQMGNRV